MRLILKGFVRILEINRQD